MAKGKHSVALFEVIQSSKASRGGLSLRTPKWWFKRRTASGATVEPNAEQESPTSAERITVPPVECTAPAPRVPGVDLKMDAEHQRIKFNMSYTSVMIAAFALVVAVGLAYIIGQRMQHGPAQAVAGPSTESVKQGPVKKGVLDVGSGTAAASAAPTKRNTSSPTAAQAPAVEKTQTPAPIAPAALVPSTPAAPIETEANGKRIIGKQYVVIQSYDGEKRATEARDLLMKNNIACTIERGVTGYASVNYYCVVGLTGFDKASGPEFDKYKAAILALNAQFRKDPKFMSFDPTATRWKG